MDKVQMARDLRDGITASKQAVQKMVMYSDMPQEEKDKLINVYDPWTIGASLNIGDIRRYEGALYEVIQAHTTQGDWTPDATPALWNVYTPKSTEEGTEIIPDFKQPTGAHDAYKKGDKVVFEDKVYESLIDANVYSPTAYPAGWQLIP